jgi:hypothetical protein
MWLAAGQEDGDVTEGDWLNAKDPTPMLSFLGGSGKAGGRKLAFFAAACLRRIAPCFTQQRSWEAIYSLELADMTGVEQLDRKAWAAREQGPLIHIPGDGVTF